ncbi:MAG: hypothetical protein KC417_09085 [Myxococcales bacterium]|nr:hypothetical protein [Myxococcales bacterium]
MSEATKVDPKFRIAKGTLWDNAWKYAAMLGGLGLVITGIGFTQDAHRVAFSWLFAFTVFLTVALGALFFVVLQHLTVASWSVTVRRIAEFFSVGVVALAFLFAPIVIYRTELYGEWMNHGTEHGGHAEGDSVLGASVAHAQGEHGEADHGAPNQGAGDHAAEAHGAPGHDGAGHEGSAEAHGADDHGDAAEAHGEHMTPEHRLHGELLDHKAPYLNVPAWMARAAIYFLVWIVLAMFYFRASTRQDRSRDTAETVKMQSWAPMATFAFGFSLTFAAFDWLMSLTPGWYSTIFGVCVFAGSAVTIHSLLIVMSLAFRNAGLLGEAVNTEHMHDLGKLTFGFIVFWAYVSFSQMMLIWYAGIPEEAVYYHLRWGDHGWTKVSVILLVGHFVFPFFFMLSRNVKRKYALVGFGAAWMLMMHIVDIYWYVLPHFAPGHLEGSLFDVSALLAVGGTYLAVVFYVMREYPLVPVGDPRLSRALHHQNA